MGKAATDLFNDAQKMLAKIIEGKWLQASAVIGFWPANRSPTMRTTFSSMATRRENFRFKPAHLAPADGTRARTANLALSDFIAPVGIDDYIGGFVVTAGIGEDKHIKRFEAAKDDYSAILLRALADRLAEAFAERMHEKVRRDYWGYAADEALGNDDLIAEKYRGIRPAPGYPAQPEHSEKATLFKLLDAEDRIGVKLTESFAMWPASSVSGFYYAHPEARLFRRRQDRTRPGGRLRPPQGWAVAEAERWLAPLLNYNPRAVDAA